MTKNSYIFGSLLLISILFVSFFLLKPSDTGFDPESDTLQRIRGAMSPKSGVEMKSGRDHYLETMLLDPATGQIPFAVRDLEISHALQMPQRQSFMLKGAAQPVTITWKEGGPNLVGGRTRALALDYSDPTGNTVVAAGVSGGVWKSIDGGDTWEMKTPPDQNMSVTSIVQHPTDPNIWYYSGGELRGNSAGARGGSANYLGNGVYKSEDNAETWFRIPETADEDQLWNSEVNYTTRIGINPITESVFLASNGIGIVRSTDGVVFDDLVLGNFGHHRYVDLIVGSNNRLLAALSQQTAAPPGAVDNSATRGIFYSDDDGQTWVNITPSNFPVTHQRTVLAKAPSNPDLVYAFTYTGVGQGSNESVSLFKIDLSDQSSVNLTGNLPQFGGIGNINTQINYNMMLAVHPTDENFVLLGATNLYRSTDGFSTLVSSAQESWIGGYGRPGLPFIWPQQHPDQHSFAFDMNNPDRVWIGHDGGLSVTENIRAANIEWLYRNDGYNTVQFYTVALPQQSGDNRVMGGTQDNGTPYFNHTLQVDQDYSNLSSGDGSYAFFGQNFGFVSSQRGNTLRLNYNQTKTTLGLGINHPDTLVSPFVTAGNYWTYVHPRSVDTTLFIHPYTINPIRDNLMYYPAGRHLWRSDKIDQIPSGRNSNASIPDDIWQRLSELAMPPNYTITAITHTVQNPVDRVYWGAHSSSGFPVIYRMDNADINSSRNNNFMDVSVSSADGAVSGAYIHGIAVNPLNGDEVIAVFSNYNVESLFHSTDGGETWTPIQGNLAGTPAVPGPSARRAAILPLFDDTVYLVGTSTGVYSATNLDGNNTVWEQESLNQIGFSVAEDIDVRSIDGTIAIGTHGRGIFIGQVDNFNPAPFATMLITEVEAGGEAVVQINGTTISNTNDVEVIVGNTDAVVTEVQPNFVRFIVPRGLLSQGGQRSAFSVEVKFDGQSLFTTLRLLPPDTFSLAQNYPNPFNSITNIPFDLPYRSAVFLAVYTIDGRKILDVLRSEIYEPGSHQAPVDMSAFASGTYFYRITVFNTATGDRVARSRPLTLLK